MSSIWEKSTEKPKFEGLKRDIKTDVLIIGGGMAGLLCAYQLSQAGINYVLVEAEEICGGVTRNTTAKITFQHGLIYDKLISKFGIERAKMYLEANKRALEKYEQLCRNIDCDFEWADSFVYSICDRKKIRGEAVALNRLGVPAKITCDLKIPISTAAAVKTPRQAQFHPLKFAYSIARDLNIFEHTKVYSIEGKTAHTNSGSITADKIIVATHFPFINSHGMYFVKQYQHRSYVLALKNAQNVRGMYVDENDKGMSFRNYGDLLLLGGGSHRTGKKGGSYRELEAFVKAHYPSAQIISRWATQDCKTLDDVAYIGQYSKNTPNLYVATGFNKWGMTTSLVASEILRDAVLGRKNEFAEVFSPSRSILTPQLFVNLGETAVNMLTPTAPRCSHLGCALKYNKAEHTWDCACHGSRFTKEGKVINGPAQNDKKF